jgi:hypothetical protein
MNCVLKLVLPIRVPLAMTRLRPEIAPVVRSPTNAQRYPMVFLELVQIGVGDEIGATWSMKLCSLESINIFLWRSDFAGPARRQMVCSILLCVTAGLSAPGVTLSLGSSAANAAPADKARANATITANLIAAL